MRPPCQPCLNLFGFVGGVVVHDDMNVEIIWNIGVNLLQKRQKFLRPVALVALADDKARKVNREKARSPAKYVMTRCPSAKSVVDQEAPVIADSM